MGKISRNTGFIAASLLSAAALVYGLARVRADGVPRKQPLWYSGTVADAAGKTLNSNYQLTVRLFESQMPAAGDTTACIVGPKDLRFYDGRFRIDVSDCAAALQKNPDLYAELTVDDGTHTGKPFERAKIGTVPFALEAQHAVSASLAVKASSADSAATSSAASGALATMIGALETRIATLETFKTQQENDSKATGYLRIGDKQIAWGVADIPQASEYRDVVFPQPFLDANFIVSALPRGAGTTRGAAMVGERSAAGVTLQWIAVDGYMGNGYDLDWIAIGRWK